MNYVSTFFIALGIYVLYRFIFDFLIPVYRASKKVQQQFRNMNQQQQSSPFSSAPPVDHRQQSAATPPKTSSKDYIDFEEIKD